LPEFAEGFRQFKNNFAVPALFLHNSRHGSSASPSRRSELAPCAGGDHVDRHGQPVTRTSIVNSFTPRTGQAGSQMAKWVSLVVKFGALVFIVFVPLQYAIQLQLLGGIWIIQTLPP